MNENIIHLIFEYGAAALGALLALVTAVTMTVEVLKRLLPKIPTDLVVFATSLTLTALAVLVAAEETSNSYSLPVFESRSFITNSAIGLLHIFPRQIKSIFIINYLD